jgi:hypothetical protein
MKLLELKNIIKKQIKIALSEVDNQAEPEEVDPNIKPEETPPPAQPVTPPQPKIITKEEAYKLIKATKGKFFTVTFIKRTDGTTRVMNARLGVRAFLRGGELPFNAEAKKLIPVYDVQKHDYRLIPWDALQELKIDNQTYKVR